MTNVGNSRLFGLSSWEKQVRRKAAFLRDDIDNDCTGISISTQGCAEEKGSEGSPLRDIDPSLLQAVRLRSRQKVHHAFDALYFLLSSLHIHRTRLPYNFLIFFFTTVYIIDSVFDYFSRLAVLISLQNAKKIVILNKYYHYVTSFICGIAPARQPTSALTALSM